jgi:hypothetical protein
MMPPNRRRTASVNAAVFVCLGLVATCGAPAATDVPPTPTVPAASDPWQQLLADSPYPYLFPLPQATTGELDGTYVKSEPYRGNDVHCLRCPDYAVDGGVWKLNLAGGVFRVYYEESGWKSLGSFLITHDDISKVELPDKLLLFNDPHCTGIVGVYTWTVQDGSLEFQAIDDTCSYQLRAANLTSRPWLSCQPPGHEAGITDHWSKPAGCD